MSFGSRQNKPLADSAPELHRPALACRSERIPQTESTPTADDVGESRQDSQNVEQGQPDQTVLNRMEAALIMLRSDEPSGTVHLTRSFSVREAAYDVAEFLHRDVLRGKRFGERTGNGRHFLTDWLRAEYLADNNVLEDMTRTGTLQFMSINLLSKTPTCHSVADDIESFIYVTLWMVGKYVARKMNRARYRAFMGGFDYKPGDHGFAKEAMVKTHPVTHMRLKNPHLKELLHKLVIQLVIKSTPLEEYLVNILPYLVNIVPNKQVLTSRKEELAIPGTEDNAGESESNADAEERLAVAKAVEEERIVAARAEEEERIAAAQAKFNQELSELESHDWMSAVLQEFCDRKEWAEIVDPAIRPKPRLDPVVAAMVPLTRKNLRDRNAREEAAKKRRVE